MASCSRSIRTCAPAFALGCRAPAPTHVAPRQAPTDADVVERGPSPELVRFRADVERLAGGPPGGLGVAVSGGPDSLALLLLATAAFPGAVRAATVDHGLRPESAGEA